MVASAVVARTLIARESALTIDGLSLASQVALVFAVVNLFLGLFNLLPIPPLDGSALLERALPARHLETWHRFRPYGILVLFLLVFWTGAVGRIMDPFLDRLYDFVA
jgi:Zn-dependent protease